MTEHIKGKLTKRQLLRYSAAALGLVALGAGIRPQVDRTIEIMALTSRTGHGTAEKEQRTRMEKNLAATREKREKQTAKRIKEIKRFIATEAGGQSSQDSYRALMVDCLSGGQDRDAVGVIFTTDDPDVCLIDALLDIQKAGIALPNRTMTHVEGLLDKLLSDDSNSPSETIRIIRSAEYFFGKGDKESTEKGNEFLRKAYDKNRDFVASYEKQGETDALDKHSHSCLPEIVVACMRHKDKVNVDNSKLFISDFHTAYDDPQAVYIHGEIKPDETKNIIDPTVISIRVAKAYAALGDADGVKKHLSLYLGRYFSNQGETEEDGYARRLTDPNDISKTLTGYSKDEQFFDTYADDLEDIFIFLCKAGKQTDSAEILRDLDARYREKSSLAPENMAFADKLRQVDFYSFMLRMLTLYTLDGINGVDKNTARNQVYLHNDQGTGIAEIVHYDDNDWAESIALDVYALRNLAGLIGFQFDDILKNVLVRRLDPLWHERNPGGVSHKNIARALYDVVHDGIGRIDYQHSSDCRDHEICIDSAKQAQASMRHLDKIAQVPYLGDWHLLSTRMIFEIALLEQRNCDRDIKYYEDSLAVK